MIRKAVSKKKRRYQKEGFDLDLSYITDKIIGMGFPSESVEGMYRNPMREVIRFLETKHSSSYKVYNLCSERNYDYNKFQNRVAHYPFDDHNAPTLDLMLRFCTDAHEWLNKDSKNIACIHCKAGKGRTGVMICGYMIYSGEWLSAEDALNFYAAMRTYNKKGVTIPSQVRYVHYMEDMIKNGFTKSLPPPVTLRMKDIIIYTIPNVKNPLELVYTISVGKTQIFKSKDKPQKILAKKGKSKAKKDDKLKTSKDDKEELDQLVFKPPPMPICGDIKVSFIDGDSESFVFWFNTSFYPELKLELPKSEIDKANKDKKKTFKNEFRIEVGFDQVDNTVSPIVKVKNPSANLSTSQSGNSESQPQLKRKATHIIPLDLNDPLFKQTQEQKILNKIAICKTSQKTANQVVENCLGMLLSMKKSTSLNEISKLPEFKDFESATSELQRVVTANLSHEESLAFWINLWNVFSIHHSIHHGVPNSLEKYLSLTTKYEVGSSLYTLPQIEFSILRHSMPEPNFLDNQKQLIPKKFQDTDPQHNNALLKSEPRIHFVLSRGTVSSPGVRIYHHELIFEQLEAATRAYLLQNIKQDKIKKQLLFPENLNCSFADFSKKQEKLLFSLFEYLPEPHQNLVKGESYTIGFSEFSWVLLK